jgi:hypothetical protein
MQTGDLGDGTGGKSFFGEFEDEFVPGLRRPPLP